MIFAAPKAREKKRATSEPGANQHVEASQPLVTASKQPGSIPDSVRALAGIRKSARKASRAAL